MGIDLRGRAEAGTMGTKRMSMKMRAFFALIVVCAGLLLPLGLLAFAGSPADGEGRAHVRTSAAPVYLPLALRRHCVMHRHGDWIIDGHESLDGCTVTLEGNLLIRPGSAFTMTDSVLLLGDSEHGLYRIAAEPGSSLVVSGSSIGPQDPGGHLAFVVEGAHFELRQSSLEGLSDLAGQPYRGGLSLKRVAGAILDGNTITHDQWFGVWLSDCSETTITNNTFDNTGPGGQSGAIYLERSHGNTITHNRLWHEWDALHLFSSWDNTVAHNQLTLTDHTIGISLWYASGNNTIAYNDISADEGAFA